MVMKKMRDIFFEDEIDYFRETTLSLLWNFVKSHIVGGNVYLHLLIDEIENGLAFDQMKVRIANLPKLILEDHKQRNNRLAKAAKLLGIESNNEDTDDLELGSEVNSPELKQLMDVLAKLFDAIENKAAHLKKHQKQLDAIEKTEREQFDWCGESRLFLALRRDDTERAMYFIHRKLFINKAGAGGKTPLMLAAEKGFDTLVQALLEQGALLNAGIRADRPYETALYFAISNKKQTTVTLLVMAGAKVYFEFKTRRGASEKYSLIKLARDFQVSLIHLPEKKSSTLLFDYLSDNVLTKKVSAYEIKEWLTQQKDYTLANFFMAYTLLARGWFSKEVYLEEVFLFKEKFTAELEILYDRHRLFAASNQSELYKAVIQSVTAQNRIDLS